MVLKWDDAVTAARHCRGLQPGKQVAWPQHESSGCPAHLSRLVTSRTAAVDFMKLLYCQEFLALQLEVLPEMPMLAGNKD